MRVGCVRLGTQEKQTTIDFKYDADDDDDDGNDVCEDLHWRCQSETSSSSSFSSLSVRPSFIINLLQRAPTCLAHIDEPLLAVCPLRSGPSS